MNGQYKISGVAHGGYGVCKMDGQTCFVPYALPDDVITLDVVRKSRGVLWGEIREVLEPSPYRADPPCTVFGKCGGCEWLHFAYPAQSEWKRRIVLDCLRRIGGIETDCEWIDDTTLRTGYRTRARFHNVADRWGFFARRSRDVVDIETCPLCHPKMNEAFAKLRPITVGKPVEITVNPDGNDILVWTKHRHKVLDKTFRSVATRDTRIERRPMFLFDGIPVVTGAFSQSSLLLQRVLRSVVTQMVGDSRSILDLYCGSGAMSLGFANTARVLGMDHNRSAIAAAAELGTGEYRVADEHEFGRAVRVGGWDAVLLDPPRSGAKSVAGNLADCDAGAIVYVSCNPATLARDLRVIVNAGWRLDRTVAVDMFPQTSHIETVCKLTRR
ncbi:MAG: class I SAM-dependent RNA methyltransferase [Candidatus Hydrogenedentes bacterium]|nr:class I SAM-dependent RNA methyltransferase [Candidatus Hydrogenedentota bacterium]